MNDHGGIDVLLIEDDQEDANYIERMLVEYGPAGDRTLELDGIERADRLSAALDALDDEPDVVLLDLNLPDSDGIETVEALTDRAPQVPIVVITGSGDADLGPAAIRQGAQDYLRKGRITDELLYRSVRYAIDRQEKQREIVTLNRRLSVLNRIVRQEIRRDVNVVIGRGDELRDRVDPELEPLTTSLLDAAGRAVERMDTAGRSLSVVSTGADADHDRINAGRIVEEEAERLREAHDVSVTVERRADADELTARASSLRSALEQVLSNAVRHTDRETPQVMIALDATATDVSITIADDGAGIPDPQQALLNDPEKRHREGSGIGTGLFLATTVVERSGGTIVFADNHPRGTVVTMTFPRAGER
jgi:signal transduction histidine kinase